MPPKKSHFDKIIELVSPLFNKTKEVVFGKNLKERLLYVSVIALLVGVNVNIRYEDGWHLFCGYKPDKAVTKVTTAPDKATKIFSQIELLVEKLSSSKGSLK